MILPFDRQRTKEEVEWELKGGTAGRILYNHLKNYGYYGKTESMQKEFDKLEREFTDKLSNLITDLIEKDYNVDNGFDYTLIADKQKKGKLINGKLVISSIQ